MVTTWRTALRATRSQLREAVASATLRPLDDDRRAIVDRCANDRERRTEEPAGPPLLPRAKSDAREWRAPSPSTGRAHAARVAADTCGRQRSHHQSRTGNTPGGARRVG